MMKIAYILSMATSGVAAWNYREIDILQQHDVEIAAYPLKWTEGPYMPREDWHFHHPNGFRTLLLQIPACLKSPVEYLRLLGLAIRTRTILEFLLANDFAHEMRRLKIEHVHCHFGDRKFFTGYYCHRILGLPFTVTVHAYEILMNPNPNMFKLAAMACEKIITVSEFNKKEIMRVFGVTEEKIKVIHIHGDMSDERMRKSIKLFIAAEFREKKGHDVLFEALKKLNRDDLTLWVAGKGQLDVKKMANEHGVDHQVVFLGAVGKDIMNILYDACDIFVLPSRTAGSGDREGIPVAIMEAMSHSKPVISTIHVGIPELVPEMLVPENDADALAKAITFLADNPDERKRQGENNLEIIKQEYSEAEVCRLKDLFAEIIDSGIDSQVH
ncbi:MAG: glycosyltransferase family 4 protein [Armatimonadetes bacterium]|nr:glycosyltransferase family 4 protein [Armatimonadota bacterium]